jgi:hypothetical protein
MKTKGFIVMDRAGAPCMLGRFDGPIVLVIGEVAHLFGTYDLARGAIRRTERYARREKLSWGGGHEIVRVVGS